MVDNRENNVWNVYIHILPKSITHHEYDKYYVGITRLTYKQRWGVAGNGYKRNKYFYRNIVKYGWENIEHFVIAEHLTRDEAEKFERTLIAKLNSTNAKHGFNMHPGGTGGEGYKQSEETRRKVSEHHADVSGGNNPFAKRVYQFTIDGKYVNQYDSCATASRLLNLNSISNNISRAVLSHRTAAGYLWEYEDNVTEENGIYKIKEYKYFPKNRWDNKTKRVFGFDRNTKELKYDCKSCAIASKITDISYSTIKYNADNKCKAQQGNYYWRYEKDVGFADNGKAYFIA